MPGGPGLLMTSKLAAATVADVRLYAGEALARYGFPDGHPLGADRQGAFPKEAQQRGLLARVRFCARRVATSEELGRFHTQGHIDKVMHAGRDHSAGFCVFSDLGVVIETLRRQYGIRRIAYMDIDVHHGDGIFYAYEEDADLIVAEIHEDGRYLYPGTGGEDETGKGAAKGGKLNIPLKPGSGDPEFLEAWTAMLRKLIA
jgi:acetoin utilization protein AcuC